MRQPKTTSYSLFRGAGPRLTTYILRINLEVPAVVVQYVYFITTISFRTPSCNQPSHPCSGASPGPSSYIRPADPFARYRASVLTVLIYILTMLHVEVTTCVLQQRIPERVRPHLGQPASMPRGKHRDELTKMAQRGVVSTPLVPRLGTRMHQTHLPLDLKAHESQHPRDAFGCRGPSRTCFA